MKSFGYNLKTKHELKIDNIIPTWECEMKSLNLFTTDMSSGLIVRVDVMERL